MLSPAPTTAKPPPPAPSIEHTVDELRTTLFGSPIGPGTVGPRRRDRTARINDSSIDEHTGAVRQSPDELLTQARRHVPDVTLEELTAARLIASEHGRGSPTEWATIVDAELNRAERRRQSLYDSLTKRARGTFGRQGSFANRHKRTAATSRDPTVAQLKIARAVLGGELRGVSRGAVRFFDPRTQDRMHAKWRAGDTQRVHSCDALGILEAWAFDLKAQTKGRRCPPDRSRPGGRHTLAWVGPIDNVDPYRLMLFAPMRRGLAHTTRYHEAATLIRFRSHPSEPSS